MLGRHPVGDGQLVVIDLRDAGDAYRRAHARRLDDQRQSEFGHDCPPIRSFIHHLVLRRRNAARNPDQLGAPFVHRQCGRHHAAAGIWNSKHFQRALDGPVLAEAAVERDKDSFESVGFELAQRALGWIESMSVDAAAFQRGKHGVARQKRNLSFRRRAAHQHGHLSELAHTIPAFRNHAQR